MTKSELVYDLILNNPQITTREVSEIIGISRRHARRIKARLFNNNKLPKILIADIETTPLEVLTWKLGKQVIPASNRLKDRSILCWCAKWLYDNTIMGDRVTGKEAFNREDYSIMGNLYWLMNQADIIIAHNGNHFDIPIIKTRFLKNYFSPTSPFKSIDTYQVARKEFGFTNNSLDSIAEFLNLPRKQKSEYEWWKKAVTEADDDSVQLIFDYCKQDIVVLEEVYTALRPWIKSHPNLNLYIDTDKSICPNCGSSYLDWKGYYYTNVNKYNAFQCLSCGAIGRSRFTDLTKEKRKVLVAPVAS